MNNFELFKLKAAGLTNLNILNILDYQKNQDKNILKVFNINGYSGLIEWEFIYYIENQDCHHPVINPKHI